MKRKSRKRDKLTGKKGQENEQPEFGLREVMFDSNVVF